MPNTSNRLNYPKDHEFIDWRIEALRMLEPDICAISNKFTISGMTPDDIAQELRIKVWEVMDRVEPDKANIRTWSMRIMNNAVRNMHLYHNYFKRRIQPIEDEADWYITSEDGQERYIRIRESS